MTKKRTKKIEIPEITRVEGHEAVYVDIEGDKVVDVRLNVFEGTRFFEKLVVGSSYSEMPHITSRVCAICSTGHVIAAIRAIEKIASFKPDQTTELFRELMHLGMIIESNSTHIFALALPDFLGFEDVYQFATSHSAVFSMWTELRNLGATIQTTIGGRPFHPINLHAGGFSRYPTTDKLALIESNLKEQFDNAIKTTEILLEHNPPVKRTSEPVYFALIPSSDHYGYFGDRIKSNTGFEAAVEDYKSYLKEETVQYSHSKRSSFQGEPIMVGSLARLNLFHHMLKGTASEIYQSSAMAKGDTNSIWNNLGQAIEIVEAMDRALEIVKLLQSNSSKWKDKKPREEISKRLPKGIHQAVGTVECPRGTLYHEFTVNEKGIIESANMITPSAQNTYRIERDIHEVVSQSIDGRNEEEIESKLSKSLETLIRAYDPCNTCATHMVKVKYSTSS